MKDKWLYVIGFAVIAAMVVGTLAYGAANEHMFEGTDDQGGDIITDLDPDYKPWWNGIFGDYELPSETESMLFAVMAALGAVIIGFFLGYMYANRKKDEIDK